MSILHVHVAINHNYGNASISVPITSVWVLLSCFPFFSIYFNILLFTRMLTNNLAGNTLDPLALCNFTSFVSTFFSLTLWRLEWLHRTVTCKIDCFQSHIFYSYLTRCQLLLGHLFQISNNSCIVSLLGQLHFLCNV